MAAFALTGCSTPAAEPEPDAAVEVASETPTPTPTPTPTAEPGGFLLDGAVDFTLDSGYSWNFTFSYAGGGFTADIADAKPGFTNFTSTVDVLSAAMTNTTPGRNAPTGTSVGVASFYAADSLACKLTGWPDSMGKTQVPETTKMRSGVYAGQTVCFIQRVASMFPDANVGDVPAGAAAKLVRSGNEASTGPRASTLEVPEAEAQAYLDALNAPLVTAVTLGDKVVDSPTLCTGEAVTWESNAVIAVYNPTGGFCA